MTETYFLATRSTDKHVNRFYQSILAASPVQPYIEIKQVVFMSFRSSSSSSNRDAADCAAVKQLGGVG